MSDITAINLRIYIEEAHYDLRVPCRITLEALKEVLRDALSAIHVSLPAQFEFEVSNKSVRLEDGILLAHYPIGDGDALRIIEKEGAHA
ncbi:MAG: type VII secretion protein, YukD family [Streptococcaceae bacterium]|jgi:uncharacterized ubiquitin-like protein YukD|nr:type VII secretion protein, YukD family [Streptococcaceae bacterium]